MTPPLVLQRRISSKNAMKIKKRSLVNADQRSCFSLVHFQHDTEDDAAQLLLSMSNIVTNEIKNDSHAFDEEGDKYHHDAVHEVSSLPVHGNDQENVFVPPQEEYANDSFSWKRARTVSIDSPQHNGLLPIPLPGEEDEEPPTLAALGLPSLISPSSTPIGRGRPLRRASLKLSQKAKREHLKLPKLPQLPPVNSDIKQYKKRAMKVAQEKKLAIKQIGRKKFSWKNYPGTYLVKTKSLIINNTRQNSSSFLRSPFLHVCRTRSLLDCEPRRVPPTFGTQLYSTAKGLQQQTHGTTFRDCFGAWLHL